MIPSFNTNNTTPINIRPNTATTQDNQASTNTNLTATNRNNNVTETPAPINRLINAFSMATTGIYIFSRSIASVAANETIESSSLNTTSIENITTTEDTTLATPSSLTIQIMLLGLAAIGIGSSVILFLLYRSRIEYQQGIRVPLQPRITEADNLINKFCKLEYKNLPLVEIDIKDIQDKNCPICLKDFDTSASTTSVNSINSNESTDTKSGWVLYEKQLYHLKDLQEAVFQNKKIPHTQQAPNPSKLQAVKIVQGLNDTPTTSNESTTKKPESFIVDIPENQDTSQFTENDNGEESKPFLETTV